MACFRPLDAWRSLQTNVSGKRGLVFDKTKGFADLPVTIACGQCIGCRLDRSRMWAVRCVHEASLHKDNCFITLTYNNENLPSDGSLHVEHFQKFMKRFRKKYGSGIRFFHCGEYGELHRRPHYHACIFGFDFADKELFSMRNGTPLYTSASLDKLWPFGFCSIGTVTFESAAYVARYIMKKVTGDVAEMHYMNIDYDTGECQKIKPEYTTMSRRPGIGKGWFEKYHSDVYPDDFVVINGKKISPPKFYDSQFEILDPDRFEKIKRRRARDALKRAADNTPERLAVKEKVKQSHINRLVRTLE